MLKNHDTLIKLYLYYNEIGTEGAKVLAEALRENDTLTELLLFDNEIGDEGARALAKALEKNDTLTSLDLASNSVSDEVDTVFESLPRVKSGALNIDM